MTTHEGEPAGQVGDVEPIGDGEFAFKVFAGDSSEAGLFVFHTEPDARKAHKLMQQIVHDAAAVVGQEPSGFIAVRVHDARKPFPDR